MDPAVEVFSVLLLVLYLAFGTARGLALLRRLAPKAGSGALRGPDGDLVALGAVLALWLPFEARLYPPLMLHRPTDFDVMPVLLLDAALFAYLAWWKLDGVGFEFNLGWADVKAALEEFGKVALPIAGLGFALGFIVWSPRVMTLGTFLLRGLGIYFLNALPEEFLFRGVMQNVLRKRLGPDGALAVTSVVFGLAHVNNPWPNWPYVALATLAGWFYGRAYERTGKVTASALVHTCVNWTWSSLFHV